MMDKLEELEELEVKMATLKVSKKTVVFKKQAEVDFYKALCNYCSSREETKEGRNE